MALCALCAVGPPGQFVNPVQKWIDFDMNSRSLALAAAFYFTAGAAQANDPRATISDYDARLAEIGAPKIQGTEKVDGKTVPASLFGDRKVNSNHVVDAIRLPRANSAAARSTCWARPPTLAATRSRSPAAR